MLCCAAVHCVIMLCEINFYSSAIDCLFLLLLVFCLPAPLKTNGSVAGREVHFIEKHADAYNGGGTFRVVYTYCTAVV